MPYNQKIAKHNLFHFLYILFKINTDCDYLAYAIHLSNINVYQRVQFEAFRTNRVMAEKNVHIYVSSDCPVRPRNFKSHTVVYADVDVVYVHSLSLELATKNKPIEKYCQRFGKG